MSKRNISYVKPQDPSFLAKLKAQIGYKEGPTVETKRQKLQEDSSDSEFEERPDREDEKPQIVVVQSGDLDAEQVAQEEARIAREAAEAPADLNQRIVFKKLKPKDNTKAETSATNTKTTNTSNVKSKKKDKTQLKANNKLSFNDEDEYEEED